MPTSMRDSLIQALESRLMLAQTGTFTDVDGDEVTIKLTGPGVFSTTLSAGATGSLQLLDVEQTTADSAISISVKKAVAGDGRLAAKTLLAGNLKSFIAPSVDFTIGGGEISAGLIRTLTVGTVTGLTLDPFKIQLAAGTNADRVKFTFANAVRMDLDIQARVTEIKGGQNIFGIWLLRSGVDKITIAGDLAAEINVPTAAAFPVAIGTLKTGFLTLQGEIGGAIGTIDAANIGNGAIGADGPIGTIKSRGDQMNMDIQAHNIKTLDARFATFTNVDIQLSSPDATGFSLRTFRGGTLSNVSISPAQNSTPGFIGSISFGDGEACDFVGAAIGSLKVTGLLNDADIVVTDPAPGGFALKSAVLGSMQGLDISAVGPIGSIKSARAGGEGLIVETNSSVGSILFTGPDESNLDIDVSTLGTLKSKGALDGTLDLRGFNAKGVAMSLLEAPGISLDINPGAGVNTQLGGIGTIRSELIANVLITARFISSLIVKAGSFGDGQVSNSTIRTNGADDNGFGIKSASLAGALNGAGLQAKQSIGSVSVGSLIDAVVQAGNFFVQPLLIDTLAAQTPGAKINQLNVTGAFSASPTWQNSYVNAPEVGKVTVKGLIDTTNGGDLHGVSTAVLGSISLRSQTNQPLAFSPVTGDNKPFGIGTDYVVRILA